MKSHPLSVEMVWSCGFWFRRAIKAVWLPLDFICESKVVSLPQRRGGNEIESRIFWSYSQRKSLIPGVLAFLLSPFFISYYVYCKTFLSLFSTQDSLTWETKMFIIVIIKTLRLVFKEYINFIFIIPLTNFILYLYFIF